jgi:pimeloyl-ACP methyl ester carboxylesterase
MVTYSFGLVAECDVGPSLDARCETGETMIYRTLLVVSIALSAVSPAGAQTGLEDKYFDSNGVRLRYVEAGRGEPVVLVHGFTESLDAAGWVGPEGIFDVLQKDFHVIAFDARGHGKSDKSHDVARYGAEMVEDITRLLDHLGIRAAHLVGYSMGGYVVGKFATTHPDRVLTATFGGSSAMSPELWRTRFRARMEGMAEGLEQGDARPLLLRPNEPPPPPEEFDRMSRDLFSRNDPLALAAAARSFGEATLVTVEEINRLSMPLLAVVGGADMAKEGVDAFKRVRPDLQVVVIDGATHFGARGVRRRPEFSAAVRNFLVAHPIRKSSSDR